MILPAAKNLSRNLLQPLLKPVVVDEYSKEVLRDQPVLYFRMNETSGMSAQNLGTASATGTYANCTLGQQGLTRGGGAILCNGVDYTGVATNHTTNYTSSCTLEAWCFSESLDSNTRHIITKNVFLANSHANFPIRITMSSGLYSFGLSMGDNYTIDLSLAAPKDLSLTHIVGVYRANGLCELYINGQLVNSATINFSISSSDAPWRFGHTTPYGGGVGLNGFAGILGDCAVYNKALAADRILAHYIAGVKK